MGLSIFWLSLNLITRMILSGLVIILAWVADTLIFFFSGKNCESLCGSWFSLFNDISFTKNKKNSIMILPL